MKVAEADPFTAQAVQVGREAIEAGSLQGCFKRVLAVGRVGQGVVAIDLARSSHVAEALIIGDDQDDVRAAFLSLGRCVEDARQAQRDQQGEDPERYESSTHGRTLPRRCDPDPLPGGTRPPVGRRH